MIVLIENILKHSTKDPFNRLKQGGGEKTTFMYIFVCVMKTKDITRILFRR
jgi:hypothetical protein